MKLLKEYKKLLENEYFDFQNSNQEKIIHSGWDYGNYFRHVLEGAGDIFRESTKEQYDVGYIMEKIRRIQEFLKKEIRREIHPDDTYETCYKHNGEKIDKMIYFWKKQPHDDNNDLQLASIKMNINLLKGDFNLAYVYFNMIKNMIMVNEKYYEYNRSEPEYYNITNYKWNEDGTLDVDGNVKLYFMFSNFNSIPFKFGTVNGNFDCSHGFLTSLEGVPKIVKGFFDCSRNNLTTLVGSPRIIGNTFYCYGNPELTKLKGFPRKVGNNIYAYECGAVFDENEIMKRCDVGGDIFVTGQEVFQ